MAGAGIFGDVSDLHFKQPHMSFLELVQFQQARLPALSKVIGLIQLRYEQLKAEAEDKPQPQPNQQGQMPDWLQNEVIDSELLFLDTALLRTLVAGSDIEPFYYDCLLYTSPSPRD